MQGIPREYPVQKGMRTLASSSWRREVQPPSAPCPSPARPEHALGMSPCPSPASPEAIPDALTGYT